MKEGWKLMPYLSTLAVPKKAAMATQEKDFPQPSASVLRNQPQCGMNYVGYIYQTLEHSNTS